MAQKPASKSKGGRPPKKREDLPAIRRAAATRARAHDAAREKIEAADRVFAETVRQAIDASDGRISLKDVSLASGISVTHLHRLVHEATPAASR